MAKHLKSGTLRFVVVLIFQEFPFHEEERWPDDPGMAPVDGRSSQVTPAPDARHVVDAIPGLAWASGCGQSKTLALA
jgi:hypothetical protein